MMETEYRFLRNEKEIEKGFDEPSVLEKLVDIKKEIAMIIGLIKCR